jgi:hypothetical protein
MTELLLTAKESAGSIVVSLVFLVGVWLTAVYNGGSAAGATKQILFPE